MNTDVLYNRDWRNKIGRKQKDTELDWRFLCHSEYMEFLKEVDLLASHYNWCLWGGGVDNYAITLSQNIRNGKTISIKMLPGDNYYYYVSDARDWNPNNVDKATYKKRVGKNIDETLKFLHNYLLENMFIPDKDDERYSILGGAYDRYYLAKKWAFERLKENQTEDNLIPN